MMCVPHIHGNFVYTDYTPAAHFHGFMRQVDGVLAIDQANNSNVGTSHGDSKQGMSCCKLFFAIAVSSSFVDVSEAENVVIGAMPMLSFFVQITAIRNDLLSLAFSFYIHIFCQSCNQSVHFALQHASSSRSIQTAPATGNLTHQSIFLVYCMKTYPKEQPLILICQLPRYDTLCISSRMYHSNMVYPTQALECAKAFTSRGHEHDHKLQFIIHVCLTIMCGAKTKVTGRSTSLKVHLAVSPDAHPEKHTASLQLPYLKSTKYISFLITHIYGHAQSFIDNHTRTITINIHCRWCYHYCQLSDIGAYAPFSIHPCATSQVS